MVCLARSAAEIKIHTRGGQPVRITRHIFSALAVFGCSLIAAQSRALPASTSSPGRELFIFTEGYLSGLKKVQESFDYIDNIMEESDPAKAMTGLKGANFRLDEAAQIFDDTPTNDPELKALSKKCIEGVRILHAVNLQVIGSRLKGPYSIDTLSDIGALTNEGVGKIVEATIGFASKLWRCRDVERRGHCKDSVVFLTNAQRASLAARLRREWGEAVNNGPKINNVAKSAAMIYRLMDSMADSADGPKAQYYQKVCADGGGEACFTLAVLYSLGVGVKKDESKFLELLQRSCSLGFGASCNRIGVFHANRKDIPKAILFYQNACDLKDGRGCANLGATYDMPGAVQDYAKAQNALLKACDLGDAEGYTYLAFMYANAHGVRLDDAKAAELYEKACDLGSMLGCRNLGIKYSKGDGIGLDRTKATELIQKACKLGDEQSCKYIGDL